MADAGSPYPPLPLVWPVKGPYRVTQEYGENKSDYTKFGLLRHNGLDVAAKLGAPILAAHAGQVWSYFDEGGYGRTVEIWYPQRGRGALFKTIYAHLSIAYAADFAWVNPGQIIGEMGTTGNSTGVHLHFGTKWIDGIVYGMRNWSDPRPYLPIRERYK